MTRAPDASEDSAGVHLKGVRKRYDDVEAVRGVDLDVRRGEFFSLLGPSGCGKTTLLRLIAGFERPDAGRIVIAGRDVTRLPPQQRPTAMVFQNYALFPTMTVGENVAYGLRVRGMKREERTARVASMLARVDLPNLERRPVTLLSGGQQQRVALARALAVEPDVLLFDEPLSNLDVALREQTRRELKQLQHRLGTTSVYVTHDQQEALALSDRVGVMRAGRLLQIGTPRELFNEPATAFIAQFLGWNVVPSPVVAHALTGEEGKPGSVLAVRPEDLSLQGESGLNARLIGTQFLGTHLELLASAEGLDLRVWSPPDADPPEVLTLKALKHRWLVDDLHIPATPA